jgi:dTMP kinase
MTTPTLPHSHTPESGLFVTFEGVEGAGKTTQIELLRDVLTLEGHAVYATREPGGDVVAESIRAVLLTPEHEVTPTTELLLFLAARAQVTTNVIRPHLEAGEIVLCDRYTDSTVAYQGYARGHDLKTVRSLNHFATGGLIPDLTILLDIDPQAGLSRQADRNRMEAESLEFHRKVREGYLAEAERQPERIRTISATGSIATIHAEVLAAVQFRLNQRGTET